MIKHRFNRCSDDLQWLSIAMQWNCFNESRNQMETSGIYLYFHRASRIYYYLFPLILFETNNLCVKF